MSSGRRRRAGRAWRETVGMCILRGYCRCDIFMSRVAGYEGMVRRIRGSYSVIFESASWGAGLGGCVKRGLSSVFDIALMQIEVDLFIYFLYLFPVTVDFVRNSLSLSLPDLFRRALFRPIYVARSRCSMRCNRRFFFRLWHSYFHVSIT